MTDRPSAPRAPVPPARRTPSTPPLLPSLAAAVLAAGVLAACASGGTAPSAGAAPMATGPLGSAPPADTNVFPQPVSVRSVNGVLDVEMNVEMATMNVGSTPQQLRAWRLVNANGVSYADSANALGFPGPTFRVKPGDRVRILLHNRLPAGNSNEECAAYAAVTSGVDSFQDCFHGYNWTNIHYHGFHVTPDSIGDDVLLMIAPDSSYQYNFVIPDNQSPGTHWYHPHKHGSVAVQVSNGMSGAFIVEGGALDSLTMSLRMSERLIAIQKVDSALNLTDGDGGKTLVNGDSVPVITMRPGEVQRWRIVNENITKTTNYEISFQDEDGPEPLLYDVARDGVQFAPANYSVARSDPSLLMAPGNRLDVFVKAPADTGTDLLRVRSVANRGARQPRFQAEAAAAAPAPLFYVRVVDDGTPVNTTLPTTLPPLPAFLANLPGTADSAQILADTSRLAVIVFADTNFATRSPTSNPPAFFLGTADNPHMQFNSDSVYTPESAAGTALPMVLDSVQTWMVMNQSPATNHPFHIHINPFQVIDVFYPQGTADPNAAFYAQLDSAAQQRGAPIWLDVLPLPLPSTSGTAGYALIRQAYQPFLNADGSVCTECGPPTGEFVMHCHILGHEERGMMQVIEIVPTAGSMRAAGPASHDAPHPHARTLSAPAPAPERGEKAGNGRGDGSGGGGGHRH